MRINANYVITTYDRGHVIVKRYCYGIKFSIEKQFFLRTRLVLIDLMCILESNILPPISPKVCRFVCRLDKQIIFPLGTINNCLQYENEGKTVDHVVYELASSIFGYRYLDP